MAGAFGCYTNSASWVRLHHQKGRVSLVPRAAETGPEDSNPRNNLRLCRLQGQCLLSLKVSARSAAQQSGNVTSAAAAADIPNARYPSAVCLSAQRSFEQTQPFDWIDKINVWRLFIFNQGSIQGSFEEM